MQPLCFFAGLLLGTAAQAQTAQPGQIKTVRQPTADRRAASYQGPRVVKDSKKLGREMLKDSKHAPLVALARQ